MTGPLDELRRDLRECGDFPLSYGQETHGELHLAALDRLDQLEAVAAAARQYLDTGRGDLDGALAALPSPAEETRCVCCHAQSAHRAFGGRVAYAECTVPGCDCNHYVQSPAEETR